MYRLDDEDIAGDLRTLPHAALTGYAQVRTVLEVAPWAGDPANARNPDGPLRVLPFDSADGSGLVFYLILERERRVDVLELVWLG